MQSKLQNNGLSRRQLLSGGIAALGSLALAKLAGARTDPNQRCAYYTDSQRTFVTPDSIPGVSLPGALVWQPGRYQYHGANYLMQNEGLYKLSIPITNTTNMIVYNGNVRMLLASLTSLIVPGQADETPNALDTEQVLLKSRARMLCGNTAAFVQWILDSKGITNRLVRCVRATTPNNFYDGHVMNEVVVQGRWQLFDINIGFEFIDASGNRLTHKQACLSVQSDLNVYRDLHFMKDRFPSEHVNDSTYGHSATVDVFLSTRPDLIAWQKDVMRIPGIDSVNRDGHTYFYIPLDVPNPQDKKTWIESLSPFWHVLSVNDFHTMFYDLTYW